MKTFVRLSALALAATLLAACGQGAPDDADHSAERPTVVVSIYPLEFLAGQIAGEDAEVINVVPAGAEPHDVELSVHDVSIMGDAEITVTVSGFQPAVDTAAAELPGTLDLAPVLDLQTRGGAIDPHFWLDPTRMITAAEELTRALIEEDPANEAAYLQRQEEAQGDLEELDEAFRSGLTECTYDTFVTGHAAFGYLADAYGLNEIAVAGIDPETEPSTAALAATRDEIRSLGLPIVFAEPGQTKVADVLAQELGIDSGVLDPVEMVSPGEDYLSLMYENLEALRGGLQCR